MPKAKREPRLGLCGGLSVEAYEAFQDAGLITSATGIGRVALLRCTLCHFQRGKEVSGKDLTACTGIEQNAYNLLSGLENEGLIRESRQEMSPQGRTPNIYFESASPVLTELAGTIPIPIRCAEVKVTPTDSI